ncbi:MAG TPA: FAD-dependent oxidoreductase [Bryobacteraceae bacterium]|jgi:dihydropyrimidine dehydrogenase (NAD+) subunit PreT|nr:FAD-dependent oxidoreductase [Bryobacteraceae bacterium]
MNDRFQDLHPALSPQAALVESQRCLYCYDAPCAAACPTHIDVPKFIKRISTGDLRGSSTAILDANILGLSCSRVCPVEVLCEGACVMHRYNKQPIEIGLLQRHAMEWFYDRQPSFAPAQENGKHVACIGAGPASLSCAAELRRHGFKVTVFDRNPLAGGLNTYGVAQYKLRPGDSLKEVELVRQMGVTFRLGEEVNDNTQGDFDAFFLGIGLGATNRLNVPGEELPHVIDALRFIALYKTGYPQIARRVVVIGAGNTAIDAAIAAKKLGAEQVHVVYRRGEADMSAFPFEYEHAKREGVEFHWQTIVTRIGTESVHCGNLKIPCDMVIPAIGQSPFRDFGPINRETGQTRYPKYFAGGDFINGGREVVDAVADGKRAAQGIIKWLSQ